MPKQPTALNIALDAVSNDLDAMGDEIATVAGRTEAAVDMGREARDEARAVNHKLDTLIDMMRERVFPAIDEIPKLRQRIAYLENPQLQPLDGE